MSTLPHIPSIIVDANLAAMREVIGPEAPLMVGANQAWALDEAITAGRRMARHNLGWLEEPVRADTPLADWARLAREQPIPLAGGENLTGLDAFDAHIAADGLPVIQPDLGKWGGFSGCLAVGERTLARGKRFCPHWLGAGIGLTASFHLKAAVGGPGYVEVDANPNPLRDLLATPAYAMQDGAVCLGMAPGLGVVPDLAAEWGMRVLPERAGSARRIAGIDPWVSGLGTLQRRSTMTWLWTIQAPNSEEASSPREVDGHRLSRAKVAVLDGLKGRLRMGLRPERTVTGNRSVLLNSRHYPAPTATK